MSRSFEFDAPDHFTVGAVGSPGQRVFYLQARQSDILMTIKCEKEQVRVFGDYLVELLAKLTPISEEPPRDLTLLEPINPVWAVCSLGVGYDGDDDRIVVEVEELVEEEEGADEPAEERATARFRITRAQAAAFIECARDLVKAGRPICQICGHPIDPGGHVCPRRNGHGAR